MKCLLEQNWQSLKRILVWHYFSVYIVYALSSIVYMKLALSRDHEDIDGEFGSAGLTCFALFIVALMTRQAQVEVMQAKAEGINYLCSFWNYIDMTGLLLVLLIVLVTGLRLDWFSLEALRVLAAFASCLTLLKLFDWLRLFEQTAFYVLLVGVTLRDVRYFILLLLTTLMMFGIPLVMLDASSYEGKELIDPAFNFWLFDLMYNQYLLSLGEFGMDNFSDHPQAVLVYFFFVLATTISQLTMLNMLIAIMGDSFDKVIENKDVNITKMKLSILGDFSVVLPQKDAEEQ